MTRRFIVFVPVLLLFAAQCFSSVHALAEEVETRSAQSAGRAAEAGWTTVLRFENARVQACRERSDGWNDLLVRLVNTSEREVRRGHAWFKDLSWDTAWRNHQRSPWVSSGRSRIYAGMQTTGRLADQRFRVQITTTSRSSAPRNLRWSIVELCP